MPSWDADTSVVIALGLVAVVAYFEGSRRPSKRDKGQDVGNIFLPSTQENLLN